MTVLEPVTHLLTTWSKRKITLQEAMEGSDRPRKPVLRVMDRLVREGYLEEIEDNKIPLKYGEFGCKRRNPTWRILSTPVYQNPKSPKRRTLRDRLWQIMRARRRFTRKELVRLSGASISSVEDYSSVLVNHGIIRVIGKDGRANVYLLIKDGGPKRPVLREMKNE